MILNNIPLLIVLTFLFLILVVGLYVGQETTTFRQYALGSKRFHTTTLVVTLLATAFGGGILMGEVPNIYSVGIGYITYLFISIAVGGWVISLLALHMGPFMEHISVAETIGSVYGRYPRVIVALLSICCSVGSVAIQINVMSSAIGMCMDSIDPRILTILSTLILIAYAMRGGIRAITITDVLQFVTFTVIIPLLVKFLFVKTGKSFLEVMQLLREQEKFQVCTLSQLYENLLIHVWYSLLYVFIFYPTCMQRIYMSSGPIQAYKVCLRVTFFSIIIVGSVVFMALFVFIGNPALKVEAIWPYILSDMPPAYKGYVVVALLGMTMSTADSSLHTAAIMVVYDVAGNIGGVKALSHVHQIRLAQLTVLVLGLLAMILTVFHPTLFALGHFVWGYLTPFLSAVVGPLFILAVFGFRGSGRTALIGMTAGVLVYCTWERWGRPRTNIPSGLFPLLANGLAMMAAHYLLPQPADKGWIGKNDQQKRMACLIRAFKKYKKRIDLE